MLVCLIIKEVNYEVQGIIDMEGYCVDEFIVDIEDVELGVINYYGLLFWQIYV